MSASDMFYIISCVYLLYVIRESVMNVQFPFFCYTCDFYFFYKKCMSVLFLTYICGLIGAIVTLHWTQML